MVDNDQNKPIENALPPEVDNEETKETLLNLLVENAFDFLERSLDEFEGAPKYSVIHFYTAIELFLKARLMADDWTLIISKRKKQQPSWEKFKEGDFKSVSLTEMKEILDKGQYNKSEFESFGKLAMHRNKMVHFYHAATTESAHKELLDSLAQEQLHAWFMLNKMLQGWDEYFYKWQDKLSEITFKLSKIREYLRTVYDYYRPGIEICKADGAIVKICPSCNYESVMYGKVLDCLTVGSCCVCNYEEPILEVKCPDCDSSVTFVNDGYGKCPQCGRTIEPKDLVSILTEDVPFDKDDLVTGLPAHCTFCDGYETVIEYEEKYFCTSCFLIFDEGDLERCDWCGHLNAGKLDDSNLTGCVECDGSLGYIASKDD